MHFRETHIVKILKVQTDAKKLINKAKMKSLMHPVQTLLWIYWCGEKTKLT